MEAMFTVTKQYRDYPASHRQPRHDGHCRFIHGHNWGFNIVFSCAKLDENDFVIDVGKLQPVKEFLTAMFDHTLLLNEDDPFRESLVRFLADTKEGAATFADIRVVQNCGMEGLARLVYEKVNKILDTCYTEDVKVRGLYVHSVECLEDSKNSATYTELFPT